MQEIKHGLFALEGEMPCSPRDIRLTLYNPPCNLDQAEREEAATRILSLSQKYNRWVGVTWGYLLEVMYGEYEKSQWIARSLRGVERAKKVHKWLRVLTLGFFPGFDEDSIEKVCELARNSLPQSAIYFTGYDFVLRGISELVEMKMLHKVVENEADGEKSHIFFPTSDLISRIMRFQGIRVG